MKKKHRKWLQHYLDNCRLHNLSEHTLKNYECDLKGYIEWLERRFALYLPQVKSTHIGEYKKYMDGRDFVFSLTVGQKLRHRFRIVKYFLRSKLTRRPFIYPKAPIQMIKGKHYSVTTKRRHLSAISNFHTYLCEYYSDKRNLFEKNPVKQKLHGIRLKDEDVDNTKLLSREDWRRLTDYTWRPREKIILFLLYYAGLRLSELVSVKLSDFNKVAGILRVTRKGGSVHKLVFQERKKLVQALEKYEMQCRPDQQFLFPGKGDREFLSPKAMYNYLIQLFESAGCPTQGLGPHSFRKACASNLYKKTKDLLLVRDYLNHKDAKVTQTYIERV
jgi:integrase/recombinase XerC